MTIEDMLSQRDLEKMKRWVQKQDKAHCPHCGDKCIINNKGGENDGSKTV